MPSLTEALRLGSIELSLIRQIMNLAPPDAINLALGELGFPMPEFLRQQAIQLLRDADPVYTPNAGLSETRAAIAEHYYPGSSLERICVTNGAEEAIFITLFALINPGDKVAIPDPDYTAYPAICQMLEAKIVRLPFMDDFHSIDWDLWERLLSAGVKALVLSNPSNPSGFTLDEFSAQKLAEICDRHSVAIIVDEIYSKLYFDKHHVSLYKHMPNIFTINGLSKSHCLSGWRLGWVFAPLEMMPSIIKAKQYISTCSNWLSQKLAGFALSPQGMLAVDSILERLTHNRQIALDHLLSHIDEPDMINVPIATPYLMIKHPKDDLAVAAALAEKGVLTVPGRAFGDSGSNWLRINYAIDKALLEKALRIVTDELYIH